MKRIITYSIIVLALLLNATPLANAKVKKNNHKVTTGVDAKKKVHATAKGKRSKPVYYVVVGGDYEDLISAVTCGESLTFGGGLWVYSVKINGKTLYRTCIDCFSTRKKAQNYINHEKEDDFYSPDETSRWWIWKSNGLAKCVSWPNGEVGGHELLPTGGPAQAPR